jgi:hypothetical protein
MGSFGSVDGESPISQLLVQAFANLGVLLDALLDKFPTAFLALL